MSAASDGRTDGRCRRAASLIIAISDNRTRTGDRALPSDHTIVAADYRVARSGGDARLTHPRAAHAGDTYRAFARRYLAFDDLSRRADRRATRTEKRRQRSSTGYACTDDRSARTADHDVRTDRCSLADGNDSHLFTKRAAATARFTEAITSRSIAFCSRSIPIGHRNGRARAGHPQQVHLASHPGCCRIASGACCVPHLTRFARRHRVT